MIECPFCGSNKAKLNNTKPGDKKIPRIYWVNCHCGATGPDSELMDEAVELRNLRFLNIEKTTLDKKHFELNTEELSSEICGDFRL